MRLLFLLSFLPILALSCYVGYSDVFDGQCFDKQASSTYDAAYTLCNSQDSHLPFILSQTENDQFHAAYNYQAWLGLHCEGDKFVWDDGTVATYTHFGGSTQVCNPSYHYFIDSGSGQWSYIASAGSTVYTICQANTRSWICDTYYLLQQGKSDDLCYLFDTKATLLPDAEANCALQNAFISPIHDQSLDDFVKRTAIGYGLTGGVLIGLQYIDGKYIWSDGSEADYLNFAPGFPDPEFGDCIAMGTGLFPGKWMNVNCSTPLPYMCTKPAGVYDESVKPAGCSDDGEFYPGDEIFSPTWGSATGPGLCDYALMDIDDRTRKVTVEILLFESNSCCDTLTIYDGLFGTTVLKKLTGYYGITSIVVTGTTNAIRMEWNATSGAHVRGWHARVGSVAA